jgi:hypothetical protein
MGMQLTGSLLWLLICAGAFAVIIVAAVIERQKHK